MSAIVSQERARGTWLTGAAGLLLLMAAFLMMLAGAPAHAHPKHGPATPSAVQLTTDPCHQLTPRSDSTTVRACLTGPVVPGRKAAARVAKSAVS
jgi:hypothetical protein